ncbi:MAG: ATP-binding cassette domain-containing protein [Gammaproteobacteria bacterium AqS3]|nr:ATP-binding cassette domain-containing protein [Gammaproteobacteria bacterium AqS3]
MKLKGPEGELLQELDLDIKAGERIAIQARRADGGGALLQLLCGQLPLRSGAMRYNGSNLTRPGHSHHLHKYRRGVELLRRGRELLDGTHLLGNGLYALEFAPRSLQLKAPDAVRVGEILGLAGFDDVYRPVSSLSAAERIRAGWARVVLRQPNVALCIGSLWALGGEDCAHIHALWKQLPEHAAAVLVSDEPAPTALKLDRRLRLDHGVLV